MRAFALMLAAVLALATIAAAHAAIIHGVSICGVNYDCSVGKDGVCPSSYQAGATCAVCDNDCGVCGENTPSLCSDGFDNDLDTLTDYFDMTPGTAAGQSCNNYTAGICASFGLPAEQTTTSNPSDAGTAYVSETALHPGNNNELRIDFDGLGGTGSVWCGSCNSGYHWNATTSACDLNNCRADMTPAPTITSFTSSFNPPGQSTAPATAIVTLSGTAPACGPLYIIDDDNNDANGVLATCGSSPCSLNLNNVAAGTYTYYGRVEDSTTPPGTHQPWPSSQTSFTVQAFDPPAVITIPGGSTAPPGSIINSVTPKWNGADAHFQFTVTDNAPNFHVVLDFGDGSPKLDEVIGFNGVTYDFVHPYTPGSYNVKLVVTDTKPQDTTDTETVNAAALTCVQGSQTGNATYDNSAAECCTNSCSKAVAGWQSCFAVNSCYPSNGTICANVGGVGTWQDRDNQAAYCEMSSASCSFETWGDLNQPQVCAGDDYNPPSNNESAAVWTYNGAVNGPPLTAAGTTNAACPQPNMCYTTAGVAGCYAGAENTVALCTDGLDNNCDGIVDGGAACGASSLCGHIDVKDQYGATSYAVGADVYLQNASAKQVTNTTGDYCFTIPTDLEPGTKNVYVSEYGYTTQQQSIALTTGGTFTLDFTGANALKTRTCNADCTNNQGYCDTSCVGVGQCQPTASEVQTLNACDPQGSIYGLKKGTEVVMDNNGTDLYVGVCCTVPANWRSAPASTTTNAALNGIETLVKYTRLVTLNGKTYKLIISTW